MKLKTLPSAIVVVVVVLGIVGFLEQVPAMPANAHVYVDSINKVYLAPICAPLVIQGKAEELAFYEDLYDRGYRSAWTKLIQRYPSLSTATAEQARNSGYKPENACRNEGAFQGDPRTVLRQWLSDRGFFTLQERWNDDGSWNW